MIGDKYPPLVIAELGINHGGSLDIAIEMVDSAHRAGVEIIKHQTHVIDDEMSPAARNIIPGNATISIYEIMKKCALDESSEIKLKEYIESKNIIFISTPFSRAAVDRLNRMNVCAYKIGSGECNNYPLLEYISKFKKPVILSTGMNTISSVRKAVDIFNSNKIPVALMHTTNLYPTPAHLVRLGGMQELQNEFQNIAVGLSDHTTSNLACFAATTLGASILERHFTDRMSREGPDIVNSMDESALNELINGSAEIHKMLGGKKVATKEEQVTMDFAFATVVAIKDIKKGERLSSDNIWVKRPGTGAISAEHFNDLIGKVSLKDIDYGMHLNWQDFT